MGTSKTTTAIIAALTSMIPTFASSQGGAGVSGGTGGLQVDLGLTSKLSVDDNFQLNPTSTGTSTIWDNTLTFGILSVGQTQSLSLTGSGVLRFADIPGRTISGFEDPNLRLSYSLDAANSRLTFDARFRKADREFLDPFKVEQEEQQFGPLVGDGGTQTDKSARLNFTTGINDPIGFAVRLSRVEKDYAGVVNPQLFDTETDSAGATVTFRPSQLTQISVNADQTWYTAQDALNTDRDTTDVNVSLRTDVTQTLILNAQLGYVDIDTTQGGVQSTSSGATGLIGLSQTFVNGSANVTLDTTRNQNGRRTTLTFGRQYQLPRGSLSASFGLTEGPNANGLDWVARVNYVLALKSSNVDISLQRAATTNANSAEVIDTRLTATYGYTIDNNSSLSLGLNYGRTEDGGAGTTPTVDRATLTASYNRALTKDWRLSGGVQMRYIDDRAATGPAKSNSLFLTLDRTFSFRP